MLTQGKTLHAWLRENWAELALALLLAALLARIVIGLHSLSP